MNQSQKFLKKIISSINFGLPTTYQTNHSTHFFKIHSQSLGETESGAYCQF